MQHESGFKRPSVISVERLEEMVTDPSLAENFRKSCTTGIVEAEPGELIEDLKENARGNKVSLAALNDTLLSNNFEVVTPLLDAILSGDTGSRREYEHTRIISFDAQSDRSVNYLKSKIKEFVISTLCDIKKARTRQEHGLKKLRASVEKQAEQEVKAAIARIEEKRGMELPDDNIINSIGLRAFHLYSSATELLEYFQKNTQEIDVVWANNSNNPFSGSLDYAALSRKVWKTLAPMMLDARFLEDVLLYKDIQLGDDAFNVILSSLRGGAWSIFKVRRFDHLMKLMEETDHLQGKITKDERTALIAELLTSNNPVRALKKKLAAGNAEAQPKSDSAVNDRQDEQAERAATAPIRSSRREWIAGVRSAVPQATYDLYRENEEAFAKDIKNLHALFRRGAFSYPEIVSRIRTGGQPGELVNEYREKLRPVSSDAPSKSVSSPVEIEVDNLVTPDEKLTLMLCSDDQKEPFSSWINSLDSNEKMKVMRRLERAADGNLGDYQGIREGVFEMRFSWGSGLRVYFSFLDQNTILLLRGGSKKTQDSDIRKAIQLLGESGKLPNEGSNYSEVALFHPDL